MPIHPTAVVDSQAQIDASVQIDPYVVIDGPVRIGAGTRVRSFVHLSGWTEIGEQCDIHPYACIGNLPQDYKYKGERSYCRLGKQVTVREGVTIHRGTEAESSTIIGDECYFMGYSHIAHNCVFGKKVGVYQGALVAGHVRLDDYAIVSAHTIVHQFVRAGQYAFLAGQGRIGMDVPPFMTAQGESMIVHYNVVGMKRAGFTPEEIGDIRQAHRTLYRKGLPFRKAVALLAESVTTRTGRMVLDFVQVESDRGYCGSQPRVRHLKSTGK